MKHGKYLFSCLIIVALFSTLSLAQEKDMMNKTKMMSKDTMMHKDNMMKDDSKMMHKDSMMKSDKMMDGMMKIYKNDGGVAINGTDPVAYFTEHKPVMGNSMYGYKWGGAEWHFANEKDLEMFKNNPDKYAPQYGGYCAYAASKNQLAPSVPEAWTIKDGKLYLNNSLKVRELFRKNIDQNIKMANENWPKLSMTKDKMMEKKMMNKMDDKMKKEDSK